MLLINFEINLILTWSTTCAISNATGAIWDDWHKPYVSAVTLSV